MKEELTKIVKDRLATSSLTKFELAEMLGITRVTLDSRLEKSNWKKAEQYLLKTIIK